MDKSPNKLTDNKLDSKLTFNKAELDIVEKLESGDFDCIKNLKNQSYLNLIKKILIERNKKFLKNLIEPGFESINLGCQIKPITIYDLKNNIILTLVDVSEDGKYGLTITDNKISKEVKLWDLSQHSDQYFNSNLIAILKCNSSPIHTAVIISNRFILSSGLDNKLFLWDLNKLKSIDSDKNLQPIGCLVSKNFISTMQYSKCGKYVLLFSTKSTKLCEIYDINEKICVRIIDNYGFNNYNVAFTSDFNFFITTKYNTHEVEWKEANGMAGGYTEEYGNIKFWSKKNKEQLERIKLINNPATGVAINNNDKLAFVASSGYIKIFNIEDRLSLKNLAKFECGDEEGCRVVSIVSAFHYILTDFRVLYDVSDIFNSKKMKNAIPIEFENYNNSVFRYALLNSWIIDDLDILQIVALIRIFGKKIETDNLRKIYNSINGKLKDYLEDNLEIKALLKKKSKLPEDIINIIFLYINKDIIKSYCIIC